MNAFINVASMTVSNPDGSNPHVKSFKPEQANQWEAVVLVGKSAEEDQFYGECGI